MKRIDEKKIKKITFDDIIIENQSEKDMVLSTKKKIVKPKEETFFIDPEINYNVRILHKKVIKYFDELNLEIVELENSLNGLGLSDKCIIKEKIETLKIKTLTRNSYIDEAREILEEYPLKKKEFQRIELMKSFLPIVKKYINISFKIELSTERTCQFCGELDVYEKCNGCGTQQEIEEKDDEKKGNSGTSKTLETLMDIYEGKKRFPKMNELKTIINGRKLSSQQIIKIIKEKKLGSKKFINQIMYELYDEDTLMDLSIVRNTIIGKYNIIQKIYNELFSAKRKNSLTCKFIFHILLHLEGFNVELETLKTVDSKIEHIKILKNILTIAEIRYPQYEWMVDYLM